MFHLLVVHQVKKSFGMDAGVMCAGHRGAIQDVRRYGRVLKQVQLDQIDRKFFTRCDLYLEFLYRVLNKTVANIFST